MKIIGNHTFLGNMGFEGNLDAYGVLSAQYASGKRIYMYYDGTDGYIGVDHGNLRLATTDGKLLLTNADGTNFNQLQFGGPTNDYPSLKRENISLLLRTANDDAYGNFACNEISSYGATYLDGYLQIGAGFVDNTETPTPTNISYYQRHYVPPYNLSTENAAIYTRIDHRPGETDFRYWLYGEITEQSIVGGSLTKVMHRGAGDAHYVAMLGDNTSSYGYESAMFGGWQDPPTDSIPKQENGFIATFQGSGGFQESVKNQANSTCFQALVHDDGVDPTDPDAWATNYGLFYANNALSNAFVARRSEYAQNYSMFKLMDHTSNQRPIWQVFADGQVWHNAEEATAISTLQSPSPLVLRGYYWGGAAEQANQTQLSHQTGGAGAGVFRIDIGNAGSETLALQINESGNMALAGYAQIGLNSLIQSTTNGNIIFTNSVGNDFNIMQFGGITTDYPALSREGSALASKFADDSDFTDFFGANLLAVPDGYLGWQNKSVIKSESSGRIVLLDNAQSSFDLLQFGGTSAAFPALKPSGVELQARTATDSGYANFRANNIIAHTGYLRANSARTIEWFLSSKMSAPSDGSITLTNTAETGFNLLQFGGTTEDFPALKKVGNGIHVRVASDDAYGMMTVGDLEVTGQMWGPSPSTLTPTGTTQDIDWSNGNGQILDLESATGDVTVTFSNAHARTSYTLEVIQDSATARDIEWPSNMKWQGGVPPVISPGNNAIDIITIYFNGESFYGSVGPDYR